LGEIQYRFRHDSSLQDIILDSRAITLSTSVRYSTDTDGDISPQDITLDTRTNCWNYRGVFSTNTYMTSVYRKKLRIRRPLPGNLVEYTVKIQTRQIFPGNNGEPQET
jgi:hypothetical protein